MVHTFEVLVDVKEYRANSSHCGTTRYEIDAESREQANDVACSYARHEYPSGVEYGIRVTRLLK
ncbi:MAG TPA: hypothetical protein V6C88_05430 [Chroococcidiopsis sp.]